ncbi:MULTISPECIES: acetyl-CoA C-acetyltransferase [unclassified Sphingomonas]|uniref:acetyl-CoA C-acetyltransferase n=1 Tax=unclassified Sphingomonas TaxID=196159 RepID=UPI0025CE7E72|nr:MULTISPECIES: acetyl-CoA C-acetyltransferase [unclassified Sphingomonas]
MTEPAYIVDILRTPGGRRNGALAALHPADLGAVSVDALLRRTGVDPAAVDDLIFGCVSQVGEQSNHLARHVVLASLLPQSVPAVTIDRQCGSAQQALHFAAQAVMSGTQDMVIAGGVEHMTRVPMGSPVRLAADAGLGSGPLSERIKARYAVAEFSQFTGAQMIADKYGFDREAMDRFALDSHRKAATAIAQAAFDAEIAPVEVRLADGTTLMHRRDEGVRLDASLDAIAAVKPIVAGGAITAANASQVTDGSSAALVVNARALKVNGLTPIARIHALAVTAGDPVVMLEEPIPATRKVLARAGLALGDIDLFEVNEAFASIPMAWLAATGADPARLNVNGGAIALGHPLGATGTKLMATLVHALRARGLRWGLQTMCEGGGIANATIVEAL